MGNWRKLIHFNKNYWKVLNKFSIEFVFYNKIAFLQIKDMFKKLIVLPLKKHQKIKSIKKPNIVSIHLCSKTNPNNISRLCQ
jgi:hypothetical protein